MERLAALYELATSYCTCREVDALLKTLAARLSQQLEARAVFVWLCTNRSSEMVCRGRWVEKAERFETVPQPVTEGLLAEMLEAGGALRLSREEVDPDALLHLTEIHRERVSTALYAPIPGYRGSEGVIEVLNTSHGEFTADDAVFLEEAAHITGQALANLQDTEKDRLAGLETVERLTALYDIGRAFNSSLELTDLLPVVAEKTLALLGAQACNLWLVDSDKQELHLARQAGEDPTTNEDDRLPLDEGLAGQAARQGAARLVTDAQDEPLLADRQPAAGDFRIETLMCAPLLKDDAVLGVVEVVNKLDGTRFNEDDLFLLGTVAEQAAIALNNANLLEAERKVHDLDALLAISKEITSTLNLDHVLTTVVHQAATVVPFDQCVIGLYDRHQFVLGAVSGEAEVPSTPEMKQLRDLLAWVAEQSEAVSADHSAEGWSVKPEGVQSALLRYLEAQGRNGFYAMTLRDEQGTVGVLALLSNTAGFLSERHLEVFAILASQITVAIRNARLYQEVPLLSIWQPMLKSKRKLEGITAGRWLEIASKTGLAALLLILVPWKYRIQSNATVVPAERRRVSAEVSGVVQQVLVREGQRVNAGDELARLDDSEDRIRLQRALTDLALAHRQLAEAEEKRDWAGANQARLTMDLHQSEVNLYQERVAKSHLRASIQGILVTPKVEENVGKLLKVGEAFCEIVDQDHLAVEMNVPETDISLVRAGGPVSLKLNAFPTLTIQGTVDRVSAQTIAAEGEQFFVTRARFPSSGVSVREGMAGQAKITSAGGWFHSGWYPLGYVLFRAPVQWAWRKAWALVP